MSTSLSISPWENIRHFSFSLPFAFDADTNHHARLHLACSASRVVLGYKNHVYLYSLPAFDLIDTLEPDEFSTLNSIHILGTILVVTCDLQSPGHSGEGSCMYIWDLSSGEIIGTIEGCGLSLYVRKSLCHPWAQAARTKQCDKWDRSGSSKHPLLIVSSKVDGRFEAKREDYILKTYLLHDTRTECTDAAVEGRQSPSQILPAMVIRPIHAASCLDSMGMTALTGGRDATVRAWDVVTGECSMVLIGHTSTVCDVSLDEYRIYSSSYDSTVRVWDRRSGDCLHVLEETVHSFLGTHFLTINPSYPYTVTDTVISLVDHAISIWDPVSRKLIHQIDITGSCKLGPIRGGERTLVTREVTEDASTHWFKIWDVKSGHLLADFPIDPYELHEKTLPFCSEDRYLIVADQQNGQAVLEVWDFRVDDLQEEAKNFGDNNRKNLGSNAMMDNAQDQKEGNLEERLIQSFLTMSVNEKVRSSRRSGKQGQSKTRKSIIHPLLRRFERR